ncbi:MAG: hypothetical protein MZV64_16560 [Ignavibacteriales bacterium]|nr:hypothetical protein [Ignavibacteriales bacterium]
MKCRPRGRGAPAGGDLQRGRRPPPRDLEGDPGDDQPREGDGEEAPGIRATQAQKVGSRTFRTPRG